jgi:hypothetical protein
MAASIHTRPPSVSLSKEPIFLTVQSNLVTLASHAQLVFVFAGSPLDGQILKITWLGKSITFTAKTSPTTNGTDFPRNGTVGEIAEAFFQNEILAADFEPLYDTALNQVKLRYRYPSPLSIDVENNLSNVSPAGFSILTHSGPLQQPNLRALVRVEKFDSEEILSTYEVPYDATTGKAVVNIQSAFRYLKPTLPSLNTAIYAANITEMFVRFHIRIADKYGVEPKSEALKVTETSGFVDSFLTVLGANKGNNKGNWGSVTNGAIVLHNRPIQNIFVSKEQPQFVYVLFSGVTFSSIIETVDVKLNNGNTVSFVVPSDVSNIALENKMAWFATGYKHLGLDQLLKTYTLDTSVYITEYTWKLQETSFVSPTIASAHYMVDRKCYAHEYYFLCENGLGGLETLRLAGLNFEEYESSREQVERTRWTDFSATEGDIDETNIRGQLLIKCQSALMPVSELKRMRQLLLGKIWVCDKANARWLRVLCDTKNIQMPLQGRNSGFLNVAFKAAWFDYSFNDM